MVVVMKMLLIMVMMMLLIVEVMVATLIVTMLMIMMEAMVMITVMVTMMVLMAIIMKIIRMIIIYMEKLLDSDWSRAVQLLCNYAQKCVIPCRNLLFRAITISKLISHSKCRKFTHKLSCRHYYVLLFHRNFFL